MKKAQLLSLGLTCLVFSIAIAVILCTPSFAEKYLPNLLQYMFPMMIVLAVIGSVFYFVDQKKRKMKNDPSYNKNPLDNFTFMVWLLTILVLALPIVSRFEKKETPDWHFALFFLCFSMWSIHTAFKHLQKRIDALEQKLNQQNQSKE